MYAGLIQLLLQLWVFQSELRNYGVSSEQVGGTGYLFLPGILQPAQDALSPPRQLRQSVVWAAQENPARFGVFVSPQYRVAIEQALQFRIVYDVGLVIIAQQLTTLLFSLRSDVFHVKQANGPVAGGGCPKVLQVTRGIIQLIDHLVHTNYIGHIFDHHQANGGTQ